MCAVPSCGGLYNYFFGVAFYLQEHFDVGPGSGTVFASASAGAFPAFALAAGLDVRDIFFIANRDLIESVGRACAAEDQHCPTNKDGRLRPLGRWNVLVAEKFAAAAASRLGGSRNAAACVSGRLFVSVTSLPSGNNVLVSDFSDVDDMIGCFLASAYIPLYDASWRPAAMWRGERWIDGGVTDNYPVPFGARHKDTGAARGGAGCSGTPSDHNIDTGISGLRGHPDGDDDAPLPSLVLDTGLWRDHDSDTGLPWVRADWAWCAMKFDQGFQDAGDHHAYLAEVLPPKAGLRSAV